MTRQRHPSSPADFKTDFEDPIENFEPVQYKDALEKALCEEAVSAVQSTPVATIDVSATVQEAVKQLSDLDIACVLVMDAGKLVGVFSERDVLNKVSTDIVAVRNKPIREVMTADPVVVYETDRVADALSVVALSGHRHVPVLDVNDRVVGVVSPQRINAFLRNHFEQIGWQG